MPLASDFEVELKGNEKDFQTGLTALSKIQKTYLGLSVHQTASALVNAKDVEINVFDGKCPAGNVGVQVNHIDPINKGEVVWTIDPAAVIFFGRLFNTGKVDLRRVIAVAGSEVKNPSYAEILIGTPLSKVLDGLSLETQPGVEMVSIIVPMMHHQITPSPARMKCIKYTIITLERHRKKTAFSIKTQPIHFAFTP